MDKKRIYTYQNTKAEQVINKVFGRPRFGDIIMYNPDYRINKAKYYQMTLLPLPSKRDLIKYKKHPQNINWIVNIDRAAEIKRKYIEREYCSFFYHWLNKNINISNNVDLICFNKFCLAPIVMSTYLVEFVEGNSNLYEIEIDNSILNGYKIEKISLNQGFKKSEIYKSSVYIGNWYKGTLNVLSSYIFKQDSSRCFITPKLRYLIDRVIGRVLIKVLTSFNIFKNRKNNDFDIGFACQIADDTSLHISPDCYYNVIEEWVNKFSNDYKSKLIIHPKERSFKSIFRYMKISRKYRISIAYGGLDNLVNNQFNGNAVIKDIYYVSSTSALKYKEFFNFKRA